MSLILRIEDAQGKGPYAPGRYTKSAFYAHEYGGCHLSHFRHPEPQSDPDIQPVWRLVEENKHPHLSQIGTRFGFPSVRAYFDWFYTQKTRELLAQFEYRICFYSVSDPVYMHISKTQVLFNRAKSALLTRAECDEELATLETLETQLLRETAE